MNKDEKEAYWETVSAVSRQHLYTGKLHILTAGMHI